MYRISRLEVRMMMEKKWVIRKKKRNISILTL